MANEKRLIDANALIESKWWDSLKDDFDKARAKIIVQSCPTVDAIDVQVDKGELLRALQYDKGYADGVRDATKHGRWEERLVDYESQYYITDCSLCGCSGERWYSYCPNCGSRMDGEDDG